MTHVIDDDLALFYYGEHPDAAVVERHIASCSQCATLYQTIAGTLDRIVAPHVTDLEDVEHREILRQVRYRIERHDQPQWQPPSNAVWPEHYVALLVWLVPVLYPFSFRAVFHSTRFAHEHPTLGAPLVLLVLMWAFAGPLVALIGLRKIQQDADSASQRLVIDGALAAAVSPVLFVLTSRTGLGLPMWYGTIACGALAALLPLPAQGSDSSRVRGLHRFSGVLIALFAAVHIANQAAAIVSLPIHAAVADSLRAVYRQPLVEMILLAAIGLQVATGVTMWRTHVRRDTLAASLQAVSGIYLATFFLTHVMAVLLARYHQTETNFVWAAGPAGLLASPSGASLLPNYLLAIVALFVHAGVYARLGALTFLPEIVVRRLSYAAIAFGGVTVVTVGLALCGIRLAP